MKRAKDGGGGHDAADVIVAQMSPVTAIDGDGDEAGKPEQHGDGVDGQQDELVGIALEEGRGQGEVGQDEQGPDGGEEQEVDLRGRVVAEEVVVEPVDFYTWAEERAREGGRC